MFEFIQEATIPKLSQTSLYVRFNETSSISRNIADEIKNSKQYQITAKDIPEIVSLMKLNGDNIVKKAVNAFEKGNIIVINNKETSKVPLTLPFIIVGKDNNYTAYVFADKIVTDINSPREYSNLMTALTSAYVSLFINMKPNMFVNNRPLMLALCKIYELMVTAPLEQRLYMKGDNLVKTKMYVITYFYMMIDGKNIKASSIPFNRIIDEKIDANMAKQIVDEVKGMKSGAFLELVKLISNINPIRYKDLDTTYIRYFQQTCGTSLIFALENITYLMTLVFSARYKTPITGGGLNRLVNMFSRKVITMLQSMNF